MIDTRRPRGGKSKVVTALLSELFDYAGLFPPAKLSMAQAANEYDKHLHSDHAWMLGRFIVPAGRLDLLVENALPLIGELPWRLSVLITNWEDDLKHLEHFKQQSSAKFQVDAIECKFENAPQAAWPDTETYLEIGFDGDVESRVQELKANDRCAKIRCGGLVAEAFPTSGSVVDVLSQLAKQSVPTKATAGLHHMFAGQRAASNAADAPRVPMHGFLNLCLASCLLHQNASSCDSARCLLDDSDASSFTVCDNVIIWHETAFTTSDIEQSRRGLFRSIGSCSFDEPVGELIDAGWL